MRSVWLATLAEVARQLSTPHQQQTPSEPWPQRQWFECFTILVYEIPESEVSVKDDLVFFVSSNGKDVMTRRKTRRQDCVYQDTIDWKSTVTMHIMMHTEYQCIVSSFHTNSNTGNTRALSHGNACLALPHVRSNAMMVFEIEGLMSPLHLRGHVPHDSIHFSLKADIQSSWIPKSIVQGTVSCSRETACVSSGNVTVEQLQRGGNSREQSLVRTFLDTVIPSFSGRSSTLELVDPHQTVVYRISLVKGSSENVVTVLGMHVIDLERFSTRIFQSLYNQLEHYTTTTTTTTTV